MISARHMYSQRRNEQRGHRHTCNEDSTEGEGEGGNRKQQLLSLRMHRSCSLLSPVSYPRKAYKLNDLARRLHEREK